MNTATQHEIGAFEAKNKLSALLDWVEAGDEVVITRRGKAVARLVSAVAGHDVARAARATEALRVATDGWLLNRPSGSHGKGVTGKRLSPKLTFSELKNAGRR